MDSALDSGSVDLSSNPRYGCCVVFLGIRPIVSGKISSSIPSKGST